MRDQHRTQGKEERQQGLFLERQPGANVDADGLDEIVPEFMHRGFYRSQEGEIDAVETVEPSGMLRAVRSESGGFRATSLRGPARAGISDEPATSDEPLQPIRSSAPVEPEPVRAPVGKGAETETRPPSPWPRPVETGGINLPLLLCLFFVVGLFMWREGTRPVVSSETVAPVPRRFKVSDQPRVTEPEQTVGETNPQPDTTPSFETAPTEEGDGSVAKVPPDEQSAEQGDLPSPVGEESAETGAPEESGQAQSDAGSAAQRAAILERMSAGTVDRNDRERRMEGDLQDTSLFPATKPQTQPQPQSRPPAPRPVAAQPAPKKPAEPAGGTGDLFPGDESATTAVERPVAPPPAATTAPAAGGKPRYQIAEPQL